MDRKACYLLTLEGLFSAVGIPICPVQCSSESARRYLQSAFQHLRHRACFLLLLGGVGGRWDHENDGIEWGSKSTKFQPESFDGDPFHDHFCFQ